MAIVNTPALENVVSRPFNNAALVVTCCGNVAPPLKLPSNAPSSTLAISILATPPFLMPTQPFVISKLALSKLATPLAS